MTKPSGPSDEERRKKPQSGTNPPPRLSAGARLVLIVFGIALALGLVFAFEGVLRMTKYGPDLRVFKEKQILGVDYWEFNRDISLRFFPPEMAKPPGFERFPKAKAPDAYRIFSLGESSTQGDPYGPQASFSAFLREMLSDLHPDRKIEMVNCGVIAISSADVLDMVPEILKQKPDALLLYVGHNEAYGADGVLSGIRGSISSREMMKARLAFRNSRIGLLYQDLMRKRAKSAPKEGFGMDTMKGKYLPRGSKLHQQMLEIYRGNLTEMIERARKQGVAVILCTTVANQRDQSPMGSAHGPKFQASTLAEWNSGWDAGKAAMNARHWDDGATALRKVVTLDPSYSEACFRLARCLDPRTRGAGAATDSAAAGSVVPGTDLAAAREQYLNARDEDIVHFRACSDQNRVVREVAKAEQAKGAKLLLVDLDQELSAISPDQIPGHEFFTEHVHPYTTSHAWIGRQICRAMSENPGFSTLGAADAASLPPTPAYLQRMGLSAIDEATGLVLTVQHKQSKWPFTEAYENRAAVGFLQQRINELAAHMDSIDVGVFAQIAKGSFLDGFDYGARHQEIGKNAQMAKKVDKAIREFENCSRYWGPWADMTLYLAHATLQAHQDARSDSLLDVAERLDPTLNRVHYIRALLRQQQGRPGDAKTELLTFIKKEPTGRMADAARRMLSTL